MPCGQKKTSTGSHAMKKVVKGKKCPKCGAAMGVGGYGDGIKHGYGLGVKKGLAKGYKAGVKKAKER